MSTRVEEAVWTLAAATETKELRDEFSSCPSVIIEVVTVGFSGTLDIQGRQSMASSYANILYFAMNSATSPTQTAAQLTYTTSTATARYAVPEYWRSRQLVMTRTAGTITINVVGLSEAIFFRSALNGLGIGGEPASLVDDATYALPTGKSGWCMAMLGDDEYFTVFTFTAAGVPTEIISGNGAPMAWADTDGFFCIYDGGAGVVIKNRTGAPKTLRVIWWGS